MCLLLFPFELCKHLSETVFDINEFQMEITQKLRNPFQHVFSLEDLSVEVTAHLIDNRFVKAE
mgnify:CR=1 FL=1